MKRHKLYNRWCQMKSRCNNSKNIHYSIYGGRGIKYDFRWEKFSNFLEDMEPTYKDGLQLDRIDNNKSYSKENCKWSTPKEQQNNKRNNKLIYFMGILDNLFNWAKFFNIKRSTLAQRYYVYHWSLEKCFWEGVN